MTGVRRRIDVIANQKTSAGNEQAVKLSIKLRDTARVTELVHGLQRDDQIEAGRKRRSPVVLLKIQLKKNRPVFELRQAAPAELQHLRRKVDQRVARNRGRQEPK